jgi:hypothetical protein
LDPKGRKWREAVEDCIMRSFISTISVMKSMRMRWAGHVAHMGEMIPEGNRPIGKTSRRWENIRMDIREIGFEGVGCIHLAKGRDWWLALVDTVMNHRVP